MFIIGGFGHKTIRKYGHTDVGVCRHCHKNVSWEIIKVTHWFTLFFVPVIPYLRRYYLSCPACGTVRDLSKDEFLNITNSGPGVIIEARSGEDPYRGKTETQANYLRQMEELKKSRRDD